jgi:hypothetical protein
VTSAGAFGTVGIQAGTLTGVTATPNAIAVHNSDAAPQPRNVTVAIPSGSIAIVFGEAHIGSPAPAPSWTGATSDSYSGTATDSFQVMLAHTSTAGSQTIGLSSSNANGYNWDDVGIAVASWGP